MMEYKDFSIKLAKQAGEIMLKHFGLNIKKDWKDDHTPLTIADTTINQLVLSSVKKQFPDHSILAEEGSDMSGDGEYVWVCDPIDGTYPFSHGIPTAVFALALVQNGKVILGLIYDPFMDRLLIAEKDSGATLNNQKIKVSFADNLKNTMVDIEGFRQSSILDAPKLINELGKSFSHSFVFKSIVYGGLLVAAGELVAVVSGFKSPWDGAALKILVEEAGGKVTDLDGNDQRYDQDIKGFIASNGILHDQILQKVKKSLI